MHVGTVCFLWKTFNVRFDFVMDATMPESDKADDYFVRRVNKAKKLDRPKIYLFELSLVFRLFSPNPAVPALSVSAVYFQLQIFPLFTYLHPCLHSIVE